MAKKRYFKKKAVLKAIGRYHRITVSRIISLYGTTNGVALAGDGAAYSLSQMLTGTSPFQDLGKQFALVKLRGIAVEVCPGYQGGGGGMICLALQQADEPNNNGVYGQPNVIPVSSVQNTRKYFKLGTSWEATNALNAIGNIKLAFQVIQNFEVQKHWNILIKLYLTFKSNL